MPRFLASLVLCAAACFLITGCGGGGPAIYHVSGKVTFGGNPIPAGRVDFFPDLASGNDGPQGFALIKDGTFDTRQGGQGHAGGSMVVRIEGFDGKSDDPKYYGTPIFNAYDIKLDLPKESGVQDLDVPASAAKGLKIPAKPRS